MSQFAVQVEALEEFASRSLDLGEGIGELATSAAHITVRDDAFGVIGDAFGLVEQFHELRDTAMEALRASSDAAYGAAESAIATEAEYLGADLDTAATVIGAEAV